MLNGPPRTIHPLWSEHHRSTASGTLTSHCTLTRASGAGTTGPDGTWTPASRTTVYDGPCRVIVAQTISGEKVQPAAAAQQTSRRYMVSLLWDSAPVQVDDIVEITQSHDANLIGRRLRVSSIDYASEQWQRDLVCWEVEAIT
ncbi:hypothetical protein EDD29_0062 [Actinocorallia herbida]|uniref:Uncharacterized protein n=1 Tax=Actinocorallia herbida TaxID=58109 RepID=A0A3N1CMQ0_9ACTN|nr:DUF6093 family protein [Actinocorallia herbida]ROO82582.1 hypothetical protein EDD29_0062 [Actinocorallia herbida]